MKNGIMILCSFLVLFGLNSCETQQTVIDGGVASPYFDGNMMEYLRSDPYNWELTLEMIEHAGLTDLFEGRVDTLPQITFLGLKSYSILRYLYDSQYKDQSKGVFSKVSDLPVDFCRTTLLKYVIKGKHLKESFGYRNMQYIISDSRQDGGTVLESLGGNKVRLYREKSSWAGVADAGPEQMGIYSLTLFVGAVGVDTPDIQPTNGVVHALNYGHGLGVI